MLDFQKELLYLWILTLNYTIMKKFYYVILSMIAIALVSCTSELDEINNTVHQQETLSGNELVIHKAEIADALFTLLMI